MIRLIQVTLEFDSTPGSTYQIEYNPDMDLWRPSTTLITAGGHRVIWVDDGPPKTIEKPGGLEARFYRVLKIED